MCGRCRRNEEGPRGPAEMGTVTKARRETRERVKTFLTCPNGQTGKKGPQS